MELATRMIVLAMSERESPANFPRILLSSLNEYQQDHIMNSDFRGIQCSILSAFTVTAKCLNLDRNVAVLIVWSNDWEEPCISCYPHRLLSPLRHCASTDFKYSSVKLLSPASTGGGC